MVSLSLWTLSGVSSLCRILSATLQALTAVALFLVVLSPLLRNAIKVALVYIQCRYERLQCVR